MKTHNERLSLTRLLWVSLSLVLTMTSGAFATSGANTANFLKIGVGARGAAMGEAQTAVSEDVTASYWNPAALSQLRFQELSLMHYDLVENVRYQQANYGFPTENKGSFAFGINRLDYGSIQGYDNAALPTGSLDASSLLLTAGWGKRLWEETPLSVGASLKYLNSDLAGYSASAPMLDAGLHYSFDSGRLRGLKLAAALRNFGSDVQYDQQGSDLPQQMILGAGLSALGGNLILAADAIQTKNEDSRLALGLEYRVFEMLRLRVGYNGISDFVGNGITYGMGLNFRLWNLDYAYVPFGDLGNTNRISVGVRFGRAVQLQHADDQVERSFRLAQRQLALGKGVDAYSTLNELLLIAPWHKPSVELKAKIEKQFEEMSASRNAAKMDADIAEYFTDAKMAFDRDELVTAKKGFESILKLQPEHVGSKVYLERIQNRYASLAYESFKSGMDYYAAGDYEKAKTAFEKTLTIDEKHTDAQAQLDKTKEVMADSTRRAQEMELMAGAGQAYKEGLAAYQKNDLEQALAKFQEVQMMMPQYEEVGRYLELTKMTYSNVLFEQSQVHLDNGQLDEAVKKLKTAADLTPNDKRVTTALSVASRDLELKNAEESRQMYKQGLEMYLNGQSDKAFKMWKRALELDSTNDEALKAIQKMEEQKKYE